jgi:hypothetical protein
MQLSQRFLAFLVLNLLAAYAPSAAWIPSIPRGVSNCNFDAAVLLRFIPISPVAFIAINISFDELLALSVLAVFLTSLVILSASLSRVRSRIVAVILAACAIIAISSYSMVQGLMFVAVVRGINAI